MKKVLFFIATLLFTTAIQAQIANITYYVSTTGDDLNIVSTPTTPWKKIEKALRMCVPLPNTSYYIQVEEGVYVINEPLVLTPNTLVDGGYPVGFGDIQGALLPRNSYIEPAQGYEGPLMIAVNPAIGTSSGIYLSFRNGNNPNGNGGALRIENCSPYVKNCYFYNCSALYGGAVYCENANISFYGNEIVECTAMNGGAVYSVNSTLFFRDFTIADNRSLYDGGALLCANSTIRMEDGEIHTNSCDNGFGGAISQSGGELSLNNINIFNNTAMVAPPMQSSGGGIFLKQVSDVVMERCRFYDNKADFGGAIYSGNVQLEITGSNIHDNLAYHSGGGIYHSGGSLQLTADTISFNTANSGNGGGIYNSGGNLHLLRSYLQRNTAHRGGALFNQSSHSATLEMCLLTHNNASLNEGSAIMNMETNLTLEHVTVADNEAKAIINDHRNLTSMRIRKSIIWGNGNGSLTDNIENYTNNPNLVSVGCSDIQNIFPWNFNIWGNADLLTISSNPQFAGIGDYHLSSNSPAIDPPCNSDVTDRIDIEETPMFGSSFDMGCYEYVSLSPRGKSVDSEGVFTIYPNPVNRGSVLNIGLDEEMKEEGEVTVELYSVLGAKVLQSTTSDRSISLPAHIAPGQYFLRIYSTDYTKIRSAKVLVR